MRRRFGARRFAYNWTVEQLKRDLDLYRETGVSTARPSLSGYEEEVERLQRKGCCKLDGW